MGSKPKNYEWYKSLEKSSLTPPQYVFPIVWSILYIMIAISGFTYFAKAGVAWSWATFFYFFQIFLNVIWSPLFFWKKLITLALVDLFLLWISVATTIYLFYQENPTAAYLLVPYNVWLSLAFYLNLYIVIFNRDKLGFKKIWYYIMR